MRNQKKRLIPNNAEDSEERKRNRVVLRVESSEQTSSSYPNVPAVRFIMIAPMSLSVLRPKLVEEKPQLELNLNPKKLNRSVKNDGPGLVSSDLHRPVLAVHVLDQDDQDQDL
jgi:hypothetical protein